MKKKISLQHVQYMPKILEPGILYVSLEFETAAHLCACGCGEKIRTPLGPTEWNLYETKRGPTLYPSIGNWQKACQSHYWIYHGEIVWAQKWTPTQIAAGRQAEELHRKFYYDAIRRQRLGKVGKFLDWFKTLLKR